MRSEREFHEPGPERRRRRCRLHSDKRPERNEIIAFRRAVDGTLTPLGVYDTGGLGLGKPHLASQGSVVLSGDGRWLFAVDAGSDELSVFAVGTDGLRLVDHVGSGGATATGAARSAGQQSARTTATSTSRTSATAPSRPTRSQGMVA